jgi:outer membrane lipoprotein carrier protein
MYRRIAIFLIASISITVSAEGLKSLEIFVQSVRSGRAGFSQAVTVPAREGRAARTKVSSGTFEFQRPGKFRFVYRKPFEQTIVADGQTLWMHDVDLNQVTARKQSQVLGSTPAAIVASATDVRSLEQDFSLQSLPDAEGLQWVQAVPRARDGQLQSVKLGLRVGARGPELAVLDIQDSIGQRSVLTFTAFEVNPVLASDVFQFKPPAGSDVVRP